MVYDFIIVGAGIVGLATAKKILDTNPNIKILVIEKESSVAKHQTSNNSGVIHSGLYYKPGSLKAINCLNGYNQLVKYCKEEEIPFEITGKIVVATKTEQLNQLDILFNRGIENKLEGIKYLKKEELNDYEPYVSGIKGLWIPQTGIVDYLNVSKSLLNNIIKKNGKITYNEKVIKIEKTTSEVKLVTNINNCYYGKLVINCGGLQSDEITKLSDSKYNDVRIIPFRGEYYKLKPEKEYLVKNLIYPVPDPNFPFLGVHFTRMMKGGVEAGPNAVLAFKKEGYKKHSFDFNDTYKIFSWPGFQKVAKKYWKTGFGEFYRSFSKTAFTKALQELIPEVQESDLVHGGAGVRAQACDKNGGLLDDFSIVQSDKMINVVNAPSPAATSSLSIGESISKLAFERF